jgi:hypothetical protein
VGGGRGGRGHPKVSRFFPQRTSAHFLLRERFFIGATRRSPSALSVQPPQRPQTAVSISPDCGLLDMADRRQPATYSGMHRSKSATSLALPPIGKRSGHGLKGGHNADHHQLLVSSASQPGLPTRTMAPPKRAYRPPLRPSGKVLSALMNTNKVLLDHELEKLKADYEAACQLANEDMNFAQLFLRYEGVATDPFGRRKADATASTKASSAATRARSDRPRRAASPSKEQPAERLRVRDDAVRSWCNEYRHRFGLHGGPNDDGSRFLKHPHGQTLTHSMSWSSYDPRSASVSGAGVASAAAASQRAMEASAAARAAAQAALRASAQARLTPNDVALLSRMAEIRAAQLDVEDQ